MRATNDFIVRGGHTVIDEPACGRNLPPGCFDADIERASGGPGRRCAECRHCFESGVLGCRICGAALADLAGGLGGARPPRPGDVLEAVEGAAVDGDGPACADFEW